MKKRFFKNMAAKSTNISKTLPLRDQNKDMLHFYHTSLLNFRNKPDFLASDMLNDANGNLR
jgi:hypothetical protein